MCEGGTWRSLWGLSPLCLNFPACSWTHALCIDLLWADPAPPAPCLSFLLVSRARGSPGWTWLGPRGLILSPLHRLELLLPRGWERRPRRVLCLCWEEPGPCSPLFSSPCQGAQGSLLSCSPLGMALPCSALIPSSHRAALAAFPWAVSVSMLKLVAGQRFAPAPPVVTHPLCITSTSVSSSTACLVFPRPSQGSSFACRRHRGAAQPAGKCSDGYRNSSLPGASGAPGEMLS